MTAVLPPVLCIVGRKNAGKTGLTVALGAELNRRGVRVMTVKHGHGFDLDRPGKDSWRHRHEGGAARTAMVGPGGFAVVGRWPEEELPLGEVVRRYLSDADMVLAEGFKGAPEPKVEIFRRNAHTDPLLGSLPEGAGPVLALVTDDPARAGGLPRFDLEREDHIRELADWVQESFPVPGRTKEP